ncbi:MAG: OmpA family protein [Planctomycetota bacterium]
MKTNRSTRTAFASALVCLAAAAGCGRVVFTPTAQQPLTLSPEQQQALAQQQQQIQQRATQLDLDNQELESLLAQTRQQSQLMRDQVAALQDQLRATTDQLTVAQKEKVDLEERTQALLASAQTSAAMPSGRPGVPAIQANNTLLRPLRVTRRPGVAARQDGDVIRVSLPSDQLFPPGAARLSLGAEQLVRNVAADLLTNYPEQIIGIEGHTDGAPVSTPNYPTSHHLSVAQATAVYEAFRRTTGAPAQQLFLIGHGANHPLVSNGTEAGRRRNRRVELVIYPETLRRR